MTPVSQSAAGHPHNECPIEGSVACHPVQMMMDGRNLIYGPNSVAMRNSVILPQQHAKRALEMSFRGHSHT